MDRRPARRIAWVMLALYALQPLAGGQLLAAQGAVRGRIVMAGGTLPPMCSVRATPLDGGEPAVAKVADNLSYEFIAIEEGAYLFEVIDLNGLPLGQGMKTLVPPGVLQLNLKLSILVGSAQELSPPPAANTPAPAAPPSVTPAPVAPPGAEVAEASSQKTTTPPRNRKKWIAVAVIVGGLGIGLLLGNNGNDSGGSSSQP